MCGTVRTRAIRQYHELFIFNHCSNVLVVGTVLGSEL